MAIQQDNGCAPVRPDVPTPNSANTPTIAHFDRDEAQMVRGAIQTQIQGVDPVHPALAKLGRILNLPVTDAEQAVYQGGGLAEPFSVIFKGPESTEPYEPGFNALLAGQMEPITGTLEDEALRAVAAWQHGEGTWDGITMHYTYLTCSPSYRVFLEDALESTKEDPYGNLSWFGASLFSAGVLAARRECGRRDPHFSDIEFHLANAVHLSEVERISEVAADPAASVEAELMARAVLLLQQRAWLAQRDGTCADGNADCLRKQYAERMGTLTALYAAADVLTRPLNDLHPLTVRATWKATSIHDPAGKDQKDGADLAQSLRQADLPALGGLVQASPGKVCVETGCRTMAWRKTIMVRVDGGDVMGPAVGLGLNTQILVGNPGTVNSPSLLLAPRDNGEVWVLFGLCKSNGMGCRNAVEVWTSVGPPATVSPLP